MYVVSITSTILSNFTDKDREMFVFESKDRAMNFLKKYAYNYLSRCILIYNEPGIEDCDKAAYPDIKKCAIEDEYAYILFENGDRIDWEIRVATKM